MSLMLTVLVLSRVPEASASPVRARVLDRMKQVLEERPAYRKAMALAGPLATP